MMSERPPDVDKFARQFRRKYDRDMTAAERQFYELTRKLLDDPPEEEGEDGVA